jgi:signal transduction histidine kinase
VVRRTLAWARDEETGPRVPADLREVVEAALRTEGGSEVRIDSEPARALVAVDALDHVLRNLVRNGREAGGRVRIDIRAGPPPTVAVEDDGPGWPADLGDRLTEPFVTTREDGAGLGLYLARRLVERMNGRLRLEDRPGGGARAVVELEPAEGDRS